ncbi:N-6 DNA methylase, partial [Escherichia coli]|nr:N-6 DNA methylase [Escherichia coli]
GGVDSSVSAYLLKQQGYQVEGLFMKNWEEDDNEEYCTAAEDLADAQAVCDKLGIHLHTINFAAEYWDNVFEYFLGEFALAEGKQGGQFYTPKSIVSLLVNMLEPYKGRVFDPC